MAHGKRFGFVSSVLAVCLFARTTANAQDVSSDANTDAGFVRQSIRLQRPIIGQAAVGHSVVNGLAQPEFPSNVQSPSTRLSGSTASSLADYRSITAAPTPRPYVSPLARRVASEPSGLPFSGTELHHQFGAGAPYSAGPTVFDQGSQVQHPSHSTSVDGNRDPVHLPVPNVSTPMQLPAAGSGQAGTPKVSGHSLLIGTEQATFSNSRVGPKAKTSTTSWGHSTPSLSQSSYSPTTPQAVFNGPGNCNCSPAPQTFQSFSSTASASPMSRYDSVSGNACLSCAPSAAGTCSEACYGSGLFGFPDQLLPMLKNSPNGGLVGSVGGELRYRYMDEQNRLRSPGPGRSEYHLWRFTPWFSIDAGDRVKLFAQVIDAAPFGYDAPYSAVGIDENRGDLLQGYIDIKITEGLNYRYGRQFLKYGSQRLLSPLAWANTYRNFEGHRLYYSGDQWDVDLFNMRSVNAAAGNVFRPKSFDRADANRQISGLYTTYKGTPNRTWDFYWLWFDGDETNNRQDGDRHTVGLRWAGKEFIGSGSGASREHWHWDFEGAYQFGTDSFGAANSADVNAGFLAMTGGRTFGEIPWSPTLDGIFYYGSGDSDPTDGDINTVYTLYPLGHALWGLIDNFSGQNLVDLGFRTSVQPVERLSLGLAVHWFNRADSADAVYNIAGAPLAVGTPGNFIGSEIDLTARLKVSDALSLEVGQFWFQYGDAIDNSSPRGNASQFYFMSNLVF